MADLPKRKRIRIEDYDYSTPGAYFITVCTANTEKIFWTDRRGELCSPANVPLSDIGMIVDNEIQKLNTAYDSVRVDKHCIMPDHIHMILTIDPDENGRTQCAPTVIYDRLRRGDLRSPVRIMWLSNKSIHKPRWRSRRRR